MKIIPADKNRIISIIPGIRLFQYLTEDEKAAIAPFCEIIEFENHERIISEGELNPFLYAVSKGAVSVNVERNCKEAYICTIGEGDIFGEAAIFMNVKRTANVSALDTVETLRIERKYLMNYIKNHPDAGIKMLMLIIYSLLQKLREPNQELAFERKSDYSQEEVDNLMQGMFDAGK